MEDDALITPEATAEYLGVRENTLAVWRCTKRVSLPFVKVGRLVRYRVSDLKQFIAAQTVYMDSSND